jgi:hypothetical protein
MTTKNNNNNNNNNNNSNDSTVSNKVSNTTSDMVSADLVGAEGKAAVAAATKRAHTSPRFNAFNEVLEVIATQVQALDPLSDDYELVKAALDAVAAEVQVLRESPRPNAKAAPADASKMFVGVEMGTGVRTIFLSVSTPTKETHGRQFAMVAGPFLNASKANKVLKDGIGSDTKRVF